MQVAMVTGEPGVGKSTLIDEFAARAEAAHEDLVVAFGLYNSRTGAGDAYLPFRDILVTLTRSPEPEPPSTNPAKPKPKAKSRHTRQILRAGAETFLDSAQDIISVFVPGGALLGIFVGKVDHSAPRPMARRLTSTPGGAPRAKEESSARPSPAPSLSRCCFLTWMESWPRYAFPGSFGNGRWRRSRPGMTSASTSSGSSTWTMN